MDFADQSGLLALIRLPLGGGEFGLPHLLGILLDLNICFFSPSLLEF